MAEDRRYRRFAARAPVQAEVEGKSFDGHLTDISAGGAAVALPPTPMFSNDMFVELHMEGYGHRQGKIVRDLPDGYAVEFNEADEIKERIAAELERLHAGPDADLD